MKNLKGSWTWIFDNLFLNLCFTTEVTNSEFGRNSRLRKALWYMASPSETTLWGRTIISTTCRAKKQIGVNQTANSDNIFKTGHLSNMSDPLTSDVTWKINTRLLLIWLSFIRIHVSLLLFALLTYSKVEEIRNLEASTRYKVRVAGIFLKFNPLRI